MLELLLSRVRPDFQIIHFSIQRDHVHLIAEAQDKRALASGMNSFASRFAKRLNKLLGGRRGKVWDHRYHRHDLATPTEVRRALAYVMENWKKHGELGVALVDPFSTAPRFDGWTIIVRARDYPPERWRLEWGIGRSLEETWPPPAPRTWLLRKGWRRRGLIELR